MLISTKHYETKGVKLNIRVLFAAYPLFSISLEYFVSVIENDGNARLEITRSEVV